MARKHSYLEQIPETSRYSVDNNFRVYDGFLVTHYRYDLCLALRGSKVFCGRKTEVEIETATALDVTSLPEAPKVQGDLR
ncbi:hypothetical protein FB471_5389 [Amycolatopsis cihanbeyliensis]|uniref:Uncharacterized protein n=1 Tax=Amycolatopsis cihanbeyliensis TaxID=1128664 RepID=A0A542DR28_AMYCI|nr:hypothetical protein FB471_5389 [Amycolatopsis cihanbeyliensis]